MKNHLNKIFSFLLISLFLWSCEKKSNQEETAFEARKCPCARETNFIKSYSKLTVRMFNSSITTFDEMKELSVNGQCSKFISYNINSDTTYFYSICNNMMGVGYVCNFPAEIKDSEARQRGILVNFSADEFEICISPPTYNNSYSNLVLTSLEKEES